MRQKIARALRKWADLFDPMVKPTTEDPRVAIRVEADTADAMLKIEALKTAAEELRDMLAELAPRREIAL